MKHQPPQILLQPCLHTLERRITRQVHELAREYGIGPADPVMPRRMPEPEPPAPGLPEGTQLTLI